MASRGIEITLNVTELTAAEVAVFKDLSAHFRDRCQSPAAAEFLQAVVDVMNEERYRRDLFAAPSGPSLPAAAAQFAGQLNEGLKT